MKIIDNEGKNIWTGEFDHDKAFDFESLKAKARINRELGTIDIQYNDDSLKDAVNKVMQDFFMEANGKADLNEKKTKLFISIEPNGHEYSLVAHTFTQSDGDEYDYTPDFKIELSDDEKIDLLESYLYYKVAKMIAKERV